MIIDEIGYEFNCRNCKWSFIEGREWFCRVHNTGTTPENICSFWVEDPLIRVNV